MTDLCYELMQSFVRDYVVGTNLYVCDVGSFDVNGTFKDLFIGHRYVGLDVVEGPNVDVVSEELYKYPFADETFDVVISGSTLEHVQDMKQWIIEVGRLVKKQGFVCIIAPAIHFCGRRNHRHPVDCWRIYPDGMRYLMEVAGIEVLYCNRTSLPLLGRQIFNTQTIGIGRKL